MHCVNNLMQGNHFDAGQLAEVPAKHAASRRALSGNSKGRGEGYITSCRLGG